MAVQAPWGCGWDWGGPRQHRWVPAEVVLVAVSREREAPSCPESRLRL